MFVQETPVEAKVEPKKEEATRVNSTAIAEMKNLLSEAEKAPQKVEKKIQKPAQKPVEKPAEKKPVEDTEQHLVPENTVHIQLDAMNELNVLSEININQKVEEKSIEKEQQQIDSNIQQVEASDEDDS